MAFTLTVATGVPTPIYKQIVDQVNLAVASGSLTPGTRMPSVRSVAEELVINPNTVARAYTDLSRDGVLDSQPGKGVFVAPRRQRYSDSERAERLSRAIQQFVHEVVLLGYSRRELIEHLESALQYVDGKNGANLSAPSVDPSEEASSGQEAKHQ